MRIVGGYRQLAERIGWPCVFRGQTRDYYHASGCLMVLPAIARSSELYTDFLSNARAFRDSLQVWLRVLAELGIETDSGISGEFSLRHSDKDMHVEYRLNHPVVVLRAKLLVAAILQHYGFPTDHLDVSTNPYVSLWFALHASSSADGGAITFHPVSPARKVRRRKPPQPMDTAEVPTLHVYLQPPFSGEEPHEELRLVDLSCLEKLSAVAQRPSRQSAVSLPGCSFSSGSPSPRILPMLGVTTPVLRWPAAIIKLYFSFEACNRTDITSETLFPKGERLYRRLLAVNAPHLAVYA